MELRINSNATVKLDKFTGLKKINTRITEFLCKNDTLEGKILIFGSYFQNDLEKKFDFKEIIPFTVVFKDSNYNVNDIACENFSYGEVVGRGLDCNFDVVVTYEVKEAVKVEARNEVNFEVTPEDQSKIDQMDLQMEEVNIEDLKPIKDMTVKEEPVLLKRPKKETVSGVENRPKKEKPAAVEVQEETNDQEIVRPEDNPASEKTVTETSLVVEEMEDLAAHNELIKEDITKHLDKVLQAKMEIKTDNDPSKKVKIGRKEESKTLVKIIYYRNANEIEHICQDNNLSLDKVFKDNKDTNFDKYRRIIVK